MNTFKKIAAVILAAATAATMAITASAAGNTFYFLNLDNKSHGGNESDNYIYSTRLSEYGTNTIKYSTIPRGMMEGNVLLSVGFDEDLFFTSEGYNEMYDYMERLSLVDSNGNTLFKGQYPQVVVDGYDYYMNVNLDSNYNIGHEFKITKTYYSTLGVRGGIRYDSVRLYFNIKDKYVLPTFNIEISNNNNIGWSNTPSYINFVDLEGTTGYVDITVPASTRGDTLKVTFNDFNVGTITLPKTLTSGFNKISWKNRY